MCKVENCLKLKLTVVAAQVGGAPGVRAQDGVSPMERSVYLFGHAYYEQNASQHCFSSHLRLSHSTSWALSIGV